MVVLSRIVVDEPDWLISELPRNIELLYDQLGSVAGADDEHRFARIITATGVIAWPQRAREQSWERDGGAGEKGIHEHNGDRHSRRDDVEAGKQEDSDDPAQPRGESNGDDDSCQISNARVTPEPAIQPTEIEDAKSERNCAQQIGEYEAWVLPDPAECFEAYSKRDQG
jgi:hypothetical protein